MHRLFKFKARAFTLIELLIVVAIIAILAAIAVPNFLEAQVRSKVSRAKNDLRTLATALEAYRVDSNHYPEHGRITAAKAVEAPALGADRADLDEFVASTITTPVAYITSIATDPFAEKLVGPEPWIKQYDYINLLNHVTLPGAPPLAIAESFVAQWGQWRASACGPDQDRGADTKNGIFYDPTNGTISDGDLVRSQTRSENGAH